MPEEPERTGNFATDQMVRDWLRKPFKPEQVGKIPASRGRPALDFVGHAAVTDRLNKIVPDATWTIDETFQHGDSFWIRGTMTIGGVSRPEYGDGDDPKEAIGNFIRRGAMRFGVAIDLWSREELESDATAGTASDRSGEDGAALQTGVPPASPEHPYPVDQATCDHRRASGAPAKATIDGVERCAKCGLSWLVVVEETRADLGAAK